MKNRGISKKKHVTSLKIKIEPKMKVFDFWAFQINMHMASREKYIFHMLFGAFHITPRIYTFQKGPDLDSIKKSFVRTEARLESGYSLDWTFEGTGTRTGTRTRTTN